MPNVLKSEHICSENKTFINPSPLLNPVLGVVNMLKQESTFRKVFGEGSLARAIEFFIINKDMDYSISELSEKTDIGRTTLHQIIPVLLDEGIIIKSREVGPSKLFRLNKESNTVKVLLKLYSSMEAER